MAEKFTTSQGLSVQLQNLRIRVVIAAAEFKHALNQQADSHGCSVKTVALLNRLRKRWLFYSLSISPLSS